MNTNFRNMVIARIDEIESQIVMRDEVCREYGEGSMRLLRQIESLLPSNDKNLIYQLEEAFVQQHSEAEILIYEQGLRDGLNYSQMFFI